MGCSNCCLCTGPRSSRFAPWSDQRLRRVTESADCFYGTCARHCRRRFRCHPFLMLLSASESLHSIRSLYRSPGDPPRYCSSDGAGCWPSLALSAIPCLVSQHHIGFPAVGARDWLVPGGYHRDDAGAVALGHLGSLMGRHGHRTC